MKRTEKTTEQLQEEIRQLKQRLDKLGQKKGFDQLQDLVENTSEIIMLLSVSGRFLFTNKAFREAIGYSTDELSLLRFEDVLHERYKDRILEDLSELDEGVRQQDFELVLRNKERKSVYLSGDINCRFEEGRPVSYRCLLRDITQRRRAENAQNLYYSIAQLNLNTQNLYDFLRRVHEELQKNIYANNFFVAIYEPEEGTIFFPYHVDEKYTIEQSETRRKMGKGIAEYAIVQNKPLILQKTDLEELQRLNEIFIYGPEVPAVMMIVPLKVGQKTIGVIGIKSYSDANKFSNRDLELLHFVSGQVAVSLNRKQFEEDITRQTARLNAIFDSSSHLIWTVKNANKRLLTSFNTNYSDLLENALGRPPQMNVSTDKMGWQLINPADRPLLKDKYLQAFAGHPQHFEMNWGALDGGSDWYEFYLNPIFPNTGGEVEEVTGIAHNITDKKNALLVIQQSEEKFRNIIESFIDIYYRTDLNGNVVMISPSVEKHTGYRPEEVIGHKVDRFFVNATESSKDIKQLLKSGNIINYEVNVRRKDGELRQFMLNIRMIRNDRGMPYEVEGVARDISDLRQYAEQLRVAKEDAEKSLKIKEQFLANMSHEIRTPMNGIIGMIDVLNQTQLNAQQQEYVQTVRKSSETLLEILNDILDLSKIEAGMMELHPVPTYIPEIVNRLLALFQQRAREKNNRFHAVISDDVPPVVLADQTRLLQILSNLTANAIKFTENGTVQVRVMLEERPGQTFIRFEVRDTGIGISQQNQKLLFNAFQQLDNSTRKSFSGTGLGLVISKELCRKMNGDMGVFSEEGAGSTFWFTIEYIPTNEDPAARQMQEKEREFGDYFTAFTPRILLVDDNAVNRTVASEILRKARCEVVTASSGEEAIASVGSYPPFDLILMDIQMPVMDGLETTRQLKEQFDNLPPIVAMTAYAMQQDRERFLENGMDDYIPKPIRAHQLLAKVEELLQKPDRNEPLDSSESSDIREVLPPDFDKEIIDQLREMVGEELLQSVFDDFFTEAAQQIALSESAFETGDVKTIQQELHTLKGNSGTIGLMRIHELTRLMEEPAKHGDLRAFAKHIEALNAAFEFAKNHIEQVV